MTKPTKWHVRPAKTQISLGIRRVWSKSSLSAWRNIGASATHWAHSEDSDQTGRMPRLIWVFAGRTVILLVLSWGGSFYYSQPPAWAHPVPGIQQKVIHSIHIWQQFLVMESLGLLHMATSTSIRISQTLFWSSKLLYGIVFSSMYIWASLWDYGTYHIGDRRLRRACASAQSRQNLRCSHTWSMEIDEGSDQKSDI